MSSSYFEQLYTELFRGTLRSDPGSEYFVFFLKMAWYRQFGSNLCFSKSEFPGTGSDLWCKLVWGASNPLRHLDPFSGIAA